MWSGSSHASLRLGRTASLAVFLLVAGCAATEPPGDAGPDPSDAASDGGTCAEPDGTVTCGGINRLCCGGMTLIFFDGACGSPPRDAGLPPPDAGAVDVCAGGAAAPGCACAAEGAIDCRGATGIGGRWRLRCTDGRWSEEPNMLCCPD
jgi:hypothetical protein